MSPLIDYAGKYSITSDGRIWSNRREFDGTRKTAGWHLTGRWIKPVKKNNGYLQVGLILPSGKRKYELVHRLVAKTFIGEPVKGQVINHINGDKADNRVENLEWCDMKHNIHHARDVLGWYRGAKNGRYIDGRAMKEFV